MSIYEKIDICTTNWDKNTVAINGHPYEILLFANKCLYVEKTIYSK